MIFIDANFLQDNSEAKSFQCVIMRDELYLNIFFQIQRINIGMNDMLCQIRHEYRLFNTNNQKCHYDFVVENQND